jgi:hypothetical protein
MIDQDNISGDVFHNQDAQFVVHKRLDAAFDISYPPSVA